MKSDPLILIVGGGIGGLTTALALLRTGLRVEVHEQAEQLLEVGAGLQLSPNATRVLDHLEIADRLSAIACEPAGKEIRLWNTGDSWKLFDLGAASRQRYGHPYYTIFRPDLQLALADAVRQQRNATIHLGSKCQSIEQVEDRVRVTFATGQSVIADVVIAADGVHSKVRETLFARDSARFSGIVAWRGVIPMEALPERLHLCVGVNWIGPGAHVINYPLRHGELLNFGGYVERDDWQVESWSAKGTTEECHADFVGWHDDIHLMIEQFEIPYKWAVMVREPLSEFVSGRVALLGDACHPTVPFLAQGAAMAIEDAYIVAQSIRRYIDDIPEGLKRYQFLRAERTKNVVEKSSAMIDRFHNPALQEENEAQAYVAENWSPENIEQRYNWLFEYDVTNIEI